MRNSKFILSLLIAAAMAVSFSYGQEPQDLEKMQREREALLQKELQSPQAFRANPAFKVKSIQPAASQLSWMNSKEQMRAEWIHWDSGVNDDAIGTGGAANFSVAARFEPSDLTSFGGHALTKIKFYPAQAATYTIKVWQGTTPPTEIYSQAVTPTINEMNIVDLTTPVDIDVTQELWIGYNVNTASGYPAGCDAGPQVAGKGNMIQWQGTWQELTALNPALTYNWNIQGYVEMLADPQAPAAVSGFTVTPGEMGVLVADLNWTNPTQMVNGDALTELSAMVIKRGTSIIATLDNPTIGAAQSYTDNAISAAGNYTYQVYGVNSAGDGLLATATVYIGEDVPGAPTNVVVVDFENDGLLTWDAPTTGLNGGYFVQENIIQYNITRNPDGATFTVPGDEEEFIDTTLPGMGFYSYTVAAVNEVGVGGSATSNVALLASEGAIFMHTGTITTCQGTFFDSGGPEGEYQNSENFTLTIFPETTGGKIKVEFVAFNLEAGYDYLYVYDADEISPDHLVGQFSGTAIPPQLESLISSHTTGALTFRFTSDGSVTRPGWQAFVSCHFWADLDAPEAPANFHVVPMVNTTYGDIFWINPSFTVIGDELTELLSIELFIDGQEEPIYVNNEPVIGETESFGFTADEPGLYTFTIFGTNSAGQGLSSTTSIWLGEDVPTAPTNVLLSAVGNGGQITWTAPTNGLNGGWINPANTVYTVKRMPGAVEVATAISATSFIDNTVPGIGTYYYTVTAINTAGVGGTGTSNSVLLGADGILLYEPFTSVPIGQLPAGWSVQGVGTTNWSVQNTSNAGGTAPEMRLYWSPSFTDLSRLITHPVNVEGYSELKLKLRHYLSNYAVSGNSIAIQVSFDQGASWENLWSQEITGSIAAQSLELYFNVPENVTTIYLGWEFQGNVYNINNWNFDNIVLEPVVEHDLVALSIAGNPTPSVGVATTYTVAIQNAGTALASGYTVKLKKQGGIEVASVDGEPLEFGETTSYELVWTPEEEGATFIYGYIDYPADQMAGNNQTQNLNVMVQPADVYVATIGTGTTYPPVRIPFDFFYRTSYSQTLYYPEELGIGGGAILAVSYTNNFATNLPNKPIMIWMGETDADDLSAGWVDFSTLQLVYDGTVDFPQGENTILIPLQSPYIYTGGNLVIYTNRVWENPYFSSNDRFYGTLDDGSNRTRRVSVDGTGPLDPANPGAGALSHWHPNTQIFFSTAGLGALEGTVSDGTAPLEDVKVSVLGTMAKTFTDEDGYYSFPYLLPNTYDVQFEKFGFYTLVAEDVEIEEDGLTQLDVELEAIPTYTVTGTVMGNDGLYLAGAAITLSGYDQYAATADLNGEFAITNVYEGAYDITVSLAGYGTYTGVVEVNMNVDLDILLIETIVTPYGLSVDVDHVAHTALFSWNESQLVMLYQHDGSIPAEPNAFYQTQSKVYGTVFNLAAYPDAVVNHIDFHHLQWGMPNASYPFLVHIVDWSTFSVIQTVGPINTLINDNWENDVMLGSVNVAGYSQVAILIQPLGGTPTDAYPCITTDATGPSGMSISAEFSNLSGYAINGPTVGDFFINLWIMTSFGDAKMVKAETLFSENVEPIVSRNGISVPTAELSMEQIAKPIETKAFVGFNVFLNGNQVASNVTTTQYLFEELEYGQYVAGVQAVYTTGLSDIATIPFSLFEHFTLTLVAEPVQGGTVSGGGAYPGGTVVAVSANASPGYFFVNWTNEQGVVVSESANFNYTMPAANVTLTANFVEISTYMVTFNVANQHGEPVGNAMVTILPSTKKANASSVLERVNSTPKSANYSYGTLTAVNANQTTPFESSSKDGEWIHWDDGVNNTSIGTGGQANFNIASRWYPADLASYNGMEITKISFFPNFANCVYTIKIWTGTGANEVYSQVATNVTIEQWNVVDLNIPFVINASEQLWFGVNINTQGGYPAGCDDGPAVAGKGNMIYWNDTWQELTALNPSLAFNWNIQAYLEAGIEPIILYTDANGQVSELLEVGAYTYTVEKVNHISVDGSFTVIDSDLSVNVVLIEESAMKSVTFNVDMTNAEGFDPWTDNVYLTGSFSDWAVPGSANSVQMTLVRNEKDSPYNFYEGFESFSDFTTDLSPWITYQVTTGPTYGSNSFDFPGEATEFAFMVFNPSQTTPPIADTHPAVDGSKYAIAVQYTSLNDNKWLITPELSINQTSQLSFWVKSITAQYGLERFKVMVSTTGTQPSDFTMISAGSYLEAPTEWTQFTFDLSAFAGQTVHIGINYVSYDAFFFMLDAFQVTAQTDLPEELIYTATVQMVAGTHEYKYFMNAGWDGGEWDGEPNRIVVVENDMVVNDTWAEYEPQYLLSLVSNPVGAGTLFGAGLYTAGTEVNIEAFAAEGYNFVSWTDDNGNIVSTTSEFVYIMPAAHTTLTANFSEGPTYYTLTLLVNPEEGGYVYGEGEYEEGEMAYIWAYADWGYEFISWTDEDGNVVSDVEEFVFTMPAADVTLTANFELGQYTITVNVHPEEGGTVTFDPEQETYTIFDEVTLAAIPSEGYKFKHWKYEGYVIESEEVLEFEMPGMDLVLDAYFVADTVDLFTLTVVANPEDGGYVWGGGVYEAEEEAYLEAWPVWGYTFISWTDADGNVVSEEMDFTFVMPAADVTLTANFEEIATYNLTLLAVPEEGGEVYGAGEYFAGEEALVWALANDGFQFQNWRKNGVVYTSEDWFWFVMPAADVTLTAHFVPAGTELYSLTLEVEPKEGGVAYGEGMFVEGEEVTVEAVPNYGYAFVSWSLDGEEVSTDALYTFEMPALDIELVATFELIPTYTVTFTVVDKVTTNALAGASVVLNGTTVLTDADGKAVFAGLYDGSYGYTVNLTTYFELTGTVVVEGADVALTVELEPVSASLITLSSITAYPNPFSSRITIANAESFNRMVVTNLIGQVVMDVPLTGSQLTVETSSLSKGVYLMTFQANDGTKVVRRMVKQ